MKFKCEKQVVMCAASGTVVASYEGKSENKVPYFIATN
jgi:hypothetical protein